MDDKVIGGLEGKLDPEIGDIFRSLIETSKDFIGIADLAGLVVYLNRAGAALVGLSQEDVAGTNISQYVFPDDQAWFHNTVIPVLQREGVWVGEGRLRHWVTGNPIDVHATVYKVGESHLATVMRDITEQKRSEERLCADRDHYRGMLEAAGVNIYLVSPDGMFIDVNPKYAASRGKTVDQIAGTFYADTHPITGEKFMSILHQVVATGKEVSYDHKSETDDCVYKRTLSPYRNRAGDITGVVVVSVLNGTDKKEIATSGSGIITACSGCFRIKDYDGKYVRPDIFFGNLFGINFSHGICPDCVKRLYPELADTLLDSR